MLEAINPAAPAYRPFEAISVRWHALLKRACMKSETGAFAFSSDEFGFSICPLDPAVKHPGNTEPTVCSGPGVTRWSRSRRRVVRELEQLDWTGVEGISLCTEDLDTIHCFIAGPTDSPYQGSLHELP